MTTERDGNRGRGTGQLGVAVALVAVLVLSLGLNLSSRRFPLSYHPDETRKVEFVLDGVQDFKHPILILQVVRAANTLLELEEPQEVVELARISSAVFGTLIVLFSFLLIREAARDWIAVLGALFVATSPIVVLHAHYFKEDMALTAFALAALVALFRLSRAEGTAVVVSLGIATGLAASSHYKSSLLLLVYAMAVGMTPSGQRRRTAFGILAALAVAGTVFLAINYPLLFDFRGFVDGIFFEAEHAVEGHHVRVGGLRPFLTFHLVESLLPGMTAWMLAWSLWGLVWALFRWRTTTWQDRVVFAYILTFYIAVELSPLKPYPGFIRYMIPVVPGLIYFACRALELVWRGTDRTWARTAMVVGVAFVLLLQGSETLGLVRHLEDDVRLASDRWADENAEKVVAELYASTREPDMTSLVTLDVDAARAEGVTHLVSSSFLFERLAIASALPGQKPYIYEFNAKYEELFEFPYVEFRPKHRSFAFSNPTIRVIDIRDGKESKDVAGAD